MSDASTPAVGSIGWVDLTVDDAEELRDFYSAVVGYGASAVDMGGYTDYCLVPPGASAPIAGLYQAGPR